MKQIPMTPYIAPPHYLSDTDKAPSALIRITLEELCALSGVRQVVTGGKRPTIACVRGGTHVLGRDTYYVGVGRSWVPSRTSALRVLEVLAHGFFDYAARECICGKGLFCPPRTRGRPPKGTRAMSAKERMAAMRARRKT